MGNSYAKLVQNKQPVPAGVKTYEQYSAYSNVSRTMKRWPIPGAPPMLGDVDPTFQRSFGVIASERCLEVNLK